MAKKASKETKIKHLFGNYELRLSDVKVEMEEVVNRTVKHVYGANSFEYGLFLYLLSDRIPSGDGIKAKTPSEIKEDLKFAESLIYMMVYTNLIFSNAEFRERYWNLIAEFVTKEVDAPESPDDEKIIEEMKAEYEAKEKSK